MSSTAPRVTVPQKILPLYVYTGHLRKKELRQVLRPSRWTPLYLDILNITVSHTLDCSSAFPHGYQRVYQLLAWDGEIYSRLLTALSGEGEVVSGGLERDSLLGVVLAYCAYLKFECPSKDILGWFKLVTEFLLTHVAPPCSKLLRFQVPNESDKYTQLGIVHRRVIVAFDPPAIIDQLYPRSIDSTVPLVIIVAPNYRTDDDFSYEAGCLLSFSQCYFVEFPEAVAYEPCLFTLRRLNRVYIVMAKVRRDYLDSVDSMVVPRGLGEGVEVTVSGYFDLGVVGDRERFVEVYMRLLISLMLREGVVEQLNESLKRKRGGFDFCMEGEDKENDQVHEDRDSSETSKEVEYLLGEAEAIKRRLKKPRNE